MTRYVKILDRRISLDDLENYLSNLYPDMEFACVGKDDHIDVFHTEGSAEWHQKLVLLMDQAMKIPGKFFSSIAVKQIPRYDTGKIMYSRLTEALNERENTGNL